ncbi:MAG: hypothetical protein CMO01_24755 [Thalassobius sp.]|nr:hypothetical protein [Thalassovita sp.]
MFRLYKPFFSLIKLSAIVLLSSMLFSCEDEEDLGPAPTVSATIPNYGEPNKDISFTNSSAAADGGTLTYQWDFGDGNQSVNASPTHEYTAPGVYAVTLTATTEKGASETFTDSLIVGERYFTKAEIYYTDTLAFINSNGDTIIRPWDKNNGPDIYFDLEVISTEEFFNTSSQVFNNVTENPIEISVTGDYLLGDESYYLYLFDDDQNEVGEFTSDEELDSYDELDIIGQGSFNPTSDNITYNPNTDELSSSYEQGIDQDTGEGMLYLADQYGTFVVLIYFQLKVL